MKTMARDFAAAFVMGFLLPAFLVGMAVAVHESEPPETAGTGSAQLSHRGEAAISAPLTPQEAYLVGVVLAEMPVEFQPEALKAQAVAARTYTHKAKLTGGKHGDGSVCKDAACCQAYISEEAYLAAGGTEEGLEKVRNAVSETAGLVLTFEGTPIEATYFSCSGGRTEAAVEVWGTDYPYLRSVESPGEENATGYRDTVRFTPEAFAKAIGFTPDGDVSTWFGPTAYTRGGSVQTAVIGGETFTGTQLRSLLSLRSASFDLEVKDRQIVITTQGYGHRVGMSQYGAEAMAASGSSYADILSHYYPGTALTPMGIDTGGNP